MFCLFCTLYFRTNNLNKFCETHFVEKHKNLRQFYVKYVPIYCRKLKKRIFISSNFNNKTSQSSYMSIKS